MPLHEHKPRIEDVKIGASCRIRLSLQNPDLTVPDMSGGVGEVVFVHRDDPNLTFTKSVSLSLDPTTSPQCFVEVEPEDTEDWVPGLYDAYGSIEAGGVTYKPTFWSRVLQSSPPA